LYILWYGKFITNNSYYCANNSSYIRKKKNGKKGFESVDSHNTGAASYMGIEVCWRCKLALMGI
jgi:hypothetical protein